MTVRGNCYSNGKEEFIVAKIRFQIAPDIEFKMELEVEGINSGSLENDG
jgi:hypothetical protein